MPYFDQAPFDVRCEWGAQGLRNLAPTGVVIIVDVLSFTTSVEMAVTRGVTVLPYPHSDETADVYARTRDARLAAKRGDSGVSLAPSSLVDAPAGLRLVLPSPNGSALSFQAASLGAQVAAGSLRNAEAVATWARSTGGPVTVIPAGERWPDGSLRPVVEDAVGAGAIIRELPGHRSPEASAMVAMFEGAAADIGGALSGCSSGRELIERGFGRDVELAAELNVSQTVPVLKDGAFVDARQSD